MGKKKRSTNKTGKQKQQRPQQVNPFTGELMDAVDWGDVFQLVETGNSRTLRKLFNEGMTFEQFSLSYEQRLEDHEYLHRAAEQGSMAMVKLLIEQGADPDELDDVYFTPLERAVQADKKQVAKYLFKLTKSDSAREQVETDLYPSRNKSKKIPEVDLELERAIENNSLKDVQALLQNGIDVNTDSLMCASDQENLETVNLLLESGADVHLRDSEGRTAVHFGRSFKSHEYDPEQHHKEIIRSAEVTARLVEAGADLHAEDNSGKTKLMSAYIAPKWGSCYQRFLDFKNHLIKANALDNRNDELLVSIRQNDIQRVKELIKSGINVNHRGELPPFAGQVTPLAIAVICGHVKMTELLIASGATPDAISVSLFFGVEDPSAEEPRPYDPMTTDLRYFRPDLSWFRSMAVAVWKNDPDMIKILAKANASLTLSSSSLGSPLIQALDLSHREAVQALLEAGANPFESKSGSKTNAVFYANLEDTPPEIKKLVNQAAKQFK